MKKVIKKVLMLTCLLVLLTGCGNNIEDNKETKKINLNDDIYYYVDYELTGENCGGFGFPKNAEDVIDKKAFNDFYGMKAVDFIEIILHKDEIEYDEQKENDAKKEWDKLNIPAIGVKDFNIGYKDHNFYFDYWYIAFVDEQGYDLKEDNKSYSACKQVEDNINNFKDKAYSIISSKNGYRLQGTCGSPMTPIFKLDEDTCREYNLSCDRW